jgi:choline dehydrogenase
MPDFTIARGRRHSAADAYLRPAMARPNLAVRTGALVENVVVRDGRANGVEYLHTGVKQSVTASREIILCGGAINSPQLLLLSGIGPRAQLAAHGIATIIDSRDVGANLMDHPGAGMEFDLAPDLAFERELRLDRLGLSFLRWLVAGKGVFGAPPLAVSANIASRPDSRPDSREVDLHFLLIPLAMESRVWFPGLAKPFGPRMGAMWSLNYPKSRGSLSLRSSDPREAPRIAFNLLSHPDDRAAMIHGCRVLQALLAQPALASVIGPMRRPAGPLETDEDILAHVRASAATAYHPSGTCRMGADAESVVDERLKVRGVDGLRVVDASIFPRLPGGNTNLPVIMVAERAAHFIRQET